MILIKGDPAGDLIRVTGDLEDAYKFSERNSRLGYFSYMYIALSTGDLILARNGKDGAVFTQVSGSSQMVLKPNYCRVEQPVTWVLFSALDFDSEANPVLFNKEWTTIDGVKVFIREQNYREGYLLTNPNLGLRAEDMDLGAACTEIKKQISQMGAYYDKFSPSIPAVMRKEDYFEQLQARGPDAEGLEYIKPGGKGKKIPVFILAEDLGNLKRIMATVEATAKIHGWDQQNINKFRDESTNGGLLNFLNAANNYFDLIERN